MLCLLISLQSHQEVYWPPIIGGAHTSTPYGMGPPVLRTPAKPDISSIHLEPDTLDKTVEVTGEPTISTEDLERFAARAKATAEEYEQKKVRLTGKC